MKGDEPLLQTWMTLLAQPDNWLALLVCLACGGLAWLLVRVVGRAVRGGSPVAAAVAGEGGEALPREASVWLGRRVVDGVLFPLLLLVLVYTARAVWVHRLSGDVFAIAVPVCLSLLLIRTGVQVLNLAFGGARWVKVMERSISWLAWLGVVLWVTGVLPQVLDDLDQLQWKVGSTRLSLRTLIEGGLTGGAVQIVMLWISTAIEKRLLVGATGNELSLRKAVSNVVRMALMFVGLMLALSAVGIDLTALSVLGGAIGVGVGFGLQKLAANYVSGFVILAERSMRIGDSVKVDGFEGKVTQINARYTVIRSVAGRESIVPNEMLITSRVENLSLADPEVSQSTVVSVGYDSDVALVMELLSEAALAQQRVLRQPAPTVALSNFGADGLEFTVSYWLADPDNGQANLRSDVNLAILAALRAHGIDIPYPQRVVHQAGARGA